MTAGGAISWRNAKQVLVALTMVADGRVHCYAMRQSNYALWLRKFVTGPRIIDDIKGHSKVFVIISQQSRILIQRNLSLLT